MHIKKLVVVLGVVLLAFLLRFWQLGAVPASPDWDEASIGYNAYSILQTGRDEYGTFLPLSLRSFDDYKPPLYVYLTVPSVYAFGLSVWAVRLPSVIFGVLAVLATYCLVRELFKQNEKEAILASLLLAISPWHIQFSRVAFEANIGLTLVIWATYFFLRGFYTKSGFVISSILFALSLYAYHSERIFVPLFVLFLFILYRRSLFPQKIPSVVMAFVVGIIVALPLVGVFTDANVLKRLQGTSSFRQKTELLSGTIPKLEYDRSVGWWPGVLFDNRRVEYAKVVTRGYLAHFSPKWLFLTGDLERHHAPGMGLLYFWELPFILIGIYQLITQKKSSGWLVLGWILLAPIAAAPTSDVPHAVRTLVSLPTYQIFTAVGLLCAYSYVQTRMPKWKFPLMTGMCAVILVSFVYYVHMYFAHTNIEYAKYWQYGYKEAVAYAQKHKSEYKKIVVSTKLEQPYIFFLFYSKFDPAIYMTLRGTLSGSFDDYEFRPIYWDRESRDGSILYIGSPDEISDVTDADIRYPDGTTAMKVTTGK